MFYSHYLISLGNFDLNHRRNTTGRNDDFLDGINAPSNIVVGIYFPNLEYACSTSNNQPYNPSKMVYHHYKRHNAERGWDGLYMEGNTDFDWNDSVFYRIKR